MKNGKSRSDKLDWENGPAFDAERSEDGRTYVLPSFYAHTHREGCDDFMGRYTAFLDVSHFPNEEAKKNRMAALSKRIMVIGLYEVDNTDKIVVNYCEYIGCNNWILQD